MTGEIFKAFQEARWAGHEEPSYVVTDRPEQAKALGLDVVYLTPEQTARVKRSLSAETDSKCVMRGPRE